MQIAGREEEFLIEIKKLDLIIFSKMFSKLKNRKAQDKFYINSTTPK